MSEFRISYRKVRGDVKQTRIIHAEGLDEAQKKLGSVYSIASVSMRCEATTTNSGEPCKNWTSGPFCRNHWRDQ